MDRVSGEVSYIFYFIWLRDTTHIHHRYRIWALWKTHRTDFTIICTGNAASLWIYVCMFLWMTLWQLAFSEHNLLVVQDKLFFNLFFLSNILCLHGDCTFKLLISRSLFVCSCLSAVRDFSQNIQESTAFSARQKRWFLQTFFFFQLSSGDLKHQDKVCACEILSSFLDQKTINTPIFKHVIDCISYIG